MPHHMAPKQAAGMVTPLSGPGPGADQTALNLCSDTSQSQLANDDRSRLQRRMALRPSYLLINELSIDSKGHESRMTCGARIMNSIRPWTNVNSVSVNPSDFGNPMVGMDLASFIVILHR
jgi:hypothetical protein